MDTKMSLKKTLMLVLAIADMGMAYLLFTNQQYFSITATLCLFALAGVSLFLLATTHDIGDKHGVLILTAACAASLLIAAYEITFNLTPPAEFGSIAEASMFVFSAAIFSCLAFYVVHDSTKHMKGWGLYLSLALCVLIIATMAFTIMYVVNPVSIPPLDEIVYSYYSSYLFVHGQNPYVVGMSYINNLYNFIPTPQLNGLYENRYGYPVLSFVSLAFVPLLNLKSLMDSSTQSYDVYTAISVFVNVITAFVLYYKSGFDRKALLASGSWLAVSFGIFYDPIHSIALLLLVFAYVERDRHMLSAVLLGLGASMSQLAWFVLPFFWILALKETGKKIALKVIAASLLTVVLINAYYFVIAPVSFIEGVFGLFGLQTLAPYGSNLMQFATAFYPLTYKYATFASITVIVFMMCLFYLYNSSLKPLLAVATMLVFLFSWRNLGEYSIAVLPLAVAVYYCPNKLDRNDADTLKGKKPILYGTAVLLLILLPTAVYAHSAYVSEDHITINSIMPRLSVEYVNGGVEVGLAGFNANISNNEAEGRNISFFIVSRGPNTASYILGKNLIMLAPESSYTYVVNYTLPVVNNNTKLFITVLTQDYIVSGHYNVTIRLPSSIGQPVNQENMTIP
jgi:hypothetical protein